MTILTKLPNIGEAEKFWYCHKCITATYHDDKGRCLNCGEKTVHIDAWIKSGCPIKRIR